MIKLFVLGAIIASSLCVLCVPSRLNAQTNLLTPEDSSTNVNVTPEENFFQATLGYLTSANPDYTWTNNTLEVSIGADFESGQQWANNLSAQYDLGKFDLEGEMRNAGIAGTIVSLEAGAGYTLLQYYSVKLQASLEGGYSLQQSSGEIEPKVIVRDKLTTNTYLGMELSEPVYFRGPHNAIPDIDIETGFTF